MSLASLKAKHARRQTTAMVLRGEISTPVATLAPAPVRDMRRRQKIVLTADGPAAHWVPGFFDCYKSLPFWGSPEADDQLESARAAWRQTHGELVDRT